ncbi:lipase [Lithospermum erythrorhizon]|uniref:Lipase n=1 Tax=Lithospermum erythrorhizon TaxID=34254 RepID=A0AAV3NUP9_LITER
MGLIGSPTGLIPVRFNKILHHHRSPPSIIRSYGAGAAGAGWKSAEKPPICTADELHYVPVDNSDWRLSLWRYLPSSQGKERNHPLLLLSGLGTNAIGYDLSPDASFARYMSNEGFDTWILELRGAGLSAEHGAGESLPNMGEITNAKSDISSISQQLSKIESRTNDVQLRTKLRETITNISSQLTNLITAGFLEAKQKAAIATQMKNFQKQLGSTEKYNWDFDHYLTEDLPAAMEYIKTCCTPKDGKLLAIGHSMGGILLYAALSQTSYNGRPSGLASIITLASSLDYTTSQSSLRYLLSIADPAKTLNVRLIPLGALLAVAYPFATRPPYFLSWLSSQVSAQNIDSEMLERLILNNFCTIPAKLLLHLSTTFENGGLRNRSGTFLYKKHLCKSNVPVLALAGDKDLICPPEAVYETVKHIPEQLVSYKVLGEPRGPHFGHYDLVGGLGAPDIVYPHIIEFLSRHD